MAAFGSRIVFHALWRAWRGLALRSGFARRREEVLASAAPGILLRAARSLAFLTVLGVALLLWSPLFVDGIEEGSGSFLAALFEIGPASRETVRHFYRTVGLVEPPAQAASS